MHACQATARTMPGDYLGMQWYSSSLRFQFLGSGFPTRSRDNRWCACKGRSPGFWAPNIGIVLNSGGVSTFETSIAITTCSSHDSARHCHATMGDSLKATIGTGEMIDVVKACTLMFAATSLAMPLSAAKMTYSSRTYMCL